MRWVGRVQIPLSCIGFVVEDMHTLTHHVRQTGKPVKRSRKLELPQISYRVQF